MACDARVTALLDVTGFVATSPLGVGLALPRLVLAPGQVAALHGASGAGKTTLLLALFGLLQRTGWRVEGRVQWRGEPWPAAGSAAQRQRLRHELAFLLQDAPGALDPLLPVGRQLEQLAGCTAAAAVAMLDQLGIAAPAAACARPPHALSGGEAQRVLLAIAFLRRPALVVADEPSASLDAGSTAELIRNLRALRDQGAAVLLATHDPRLLRELDAEVYTCRAGSFELGVPAAAAWPLAAPPPAAPEPVLQARGLRLGRAGRTVLDGLDLTLHRGEIVAVVGESGIGKTTLLRVLAGHQRPDAGTIERAPQRTAVQLVWQDAMASLTPGRTLQSLLAEAHAPDFVAAAGAAAVRLPIALLARTREQLSGGERRRAALLRALAVAPEVLLLDEPLAALDRATAIEVMAMLLELQRSRSLALLLVTHDEELAAVVAHRVLRLQGGRLCRC
jgi:peptide/nickel transport system ATP-binding protein